MNVFWDLTGLFAPPAAAAGCYWFYTRFTSIPYFYFLGWFVGAACGGTTALLGGDYQLAVCYGISAIAAASFSWWRRNRKRVKQLAGAKTQAIRAAMAERMKQVTPSPPLRPVRNPA